MTKQVQLKQTIEKLRGFDKESHAKSLASGIMRSTKEDELAARIEKANAVVAMLRSYGVSSFFAAEYAKIFTDPEKALETKGRMMATFQVKLSLSEKQSAKMADCIVFTAAKKFDSTTIRRLFSYSYGALKAGVPFDVVADAVYYAPADVSPADLARRIVATSLKKGKPLGISESALSDRMSESLPLNLCLFEDI